MEFKVLLIMDDAGGHPLDLYYEGVQLELLPANATSLLQPMDQGVIRPLKALYTWNSLERLLKQWTVTGFSPEEIQHSAIDKAVQLAGTLGEEGFDGITEDEVGTFTDAHSEPLMDKDLEELMKSAREEEDAAGSGDGDKEEDECLSWNVCPYLRGQPGHYRK
ncbi:uncharacterized protein [Macrobrachium rosenbergii]|uniref:uncharacterized protein n=1 Tax=Macrobrachium rosenbergii TaxID=79674 RepID=UPI0034D51A77